MDSKIEEMITKSLAEALRDVKNIGSSLTAVAEMCLQALKITTTISRRQ